MGTPDFEFAIRGRTFQTLAEEQLHRNLPRRETIDFDLPLDGDDEPDVALELGLRPHRIRVDLQQNGDLHLKAEIEVSILSLRRLLDLNHAFPSGSEIDETGVVMPEVPVVPLEADLGDAGLLIGVPLVSLDVVDFLSKPTATGDLELHAVLDPFSFIVLPNIGGLAQVLTRRLGSVLDRLIGGVFGDTHLGEVLRQVVDFAERVAQRILVLTKLPERILEALAEGGGYPLPLPGSRLP